MTVEQTTYNEPSCQFPVGLRVLAVDDDPTSLAILEALLRECQYHVTTSNHTIAALALLRENKNKFDLVISNVCGADMDDFKLLELMGLEMDLPVILTSATGGTEIVMEGINHGARDFLMKPLQIEELRNIWQHVVRNDWKNGKNSDNPHQESERGKGLKSSGDLDLNVKLNQKQKDKTEDVGENRGHSNQDPSTKKPPHFVWTIDLHRKFVAAVNQLGVDKATPKRICELMNEEQLTREIVANHLQKYRLFLKRISYTTSQQAKTVTALGGSSSAHLKIDI